MLQREEEKKRPEPTAEEKALIRRAQLSVHHHSTGREMSTRGAASVLLPPDVRPLPLATALAHLKRLDPSAFRDAVWRLLRASPVPVVDEGTTLDEVYPREVLADEEAAGWVRTFHERRMTYRRGAPLLAAAFAAKAGGRDGELAALLEMLKQPYDAELESLAQCSHTLLGVEAPDLLLAMMDGEPGKQPLTQMHKLDRELGLDLFRQVTDLVDAAAFMEAARLSPSDEPNAVSVLPASSAVRQNVDSLTTSAVVVAIVRGNFDTLARAFDPQCWWMSSSVIKSTQYVADPVKLRAQAAHAAGAGDGSDCYLKEVAEVLWGATSLQGGVFDNVLRTAFVRDSKTQYLNVDYALSRSISSRVLWDERPGGLLLNEGYLRAIRIPVAPESGKHPMWRLTMRKALRFTDRTPVSERYGWMDTGQSVNYLAPAALNWWLESEMYSLEGKAYQSKQTVAKNLKALAAERPGHAA